MFTTEFGVASLILKEIPYRGEAYIHLQATEQPEALLQECVGFCRACGAVRFYATGHLSLAQYPLHTSIIRMECAIPSLPPTDAALFPVLPETLSQWRSIYNEKMAAVPNASYMTEMDAKKLLDDGSGYFVHRGGQLLGIGKAADGFLSAIAATVPGAGKDVVAALASCLRTDTAALQVASANTRAMHLYKKLGFVPVQEVSRWHCIDV